MPKGFVARNNLTKQTLLKIFSIGLFIVASSSPRFLSQAAKLYFKDKTEKAVRARVRKLRELERRKLVDFKELGGGRVQIKISYLGKNVVRLYDLDNIKLNAGKWDGSWRIIIYDIPASQRAASNAFREKIRSLGLFPIQKSVWVSPYACLPEIEFLADVFGIDMQRCVFHFTAKSIPREKEARKFFSL